MYFLHILWQGFCLKYFVKLMFWFGLFFFSRAHSNLNLKVTFIWLSTINKCYMMENLQVALLLLTMQRLLMLSYALNPHQRKILQFLYTPPMLLCFRFVLLHCCSGFTVSSTLFEQEDNLCANPQRYCCFVLLQFLMYLSLELFFLCSLPRAKNYHFLI